ncbi:MAG: M20/M25/M40 family metallo-hydrolase [Planctomycetes bacterium]|nr:M20/M25/M40 family metallo-hydrolase [Planctomycetota bacterium]
MPMSATNPYLDLDKRLLGEVFTSALPMANLRTLCDEFGNRFAGTPGERQTVEFLKAKFAEYGLANVHEEPFEYNGWTRRGEPKLEATAPVQRTFPCISLPYSPPTGDAGVEAPLLDVGDAAPDDYERLGPEVAGKIVLANSKWPAYLGRWLHRVEKFGRAVRLGAKGFVFMNHNEGLLPATGSLRWNREAEIPGVGVSRETGASLLRLADKGPISVKLVTQDVTSRMTSWNVVAEIIGGEKPDEVVIVGGHSDGHDITQGARDNASGIITILEAARVLVACQAPLKRTVRFVCFSAEEIGLIGAHEYVNAHRDDMANVRLMLNIDSVPQAKPVGLAFNGWPQAKTFVNALAKEMSWELPFANKVQPYSDHFPFLLEGVPTAWLTNMDTPATGRGFGHTAADTVDKVDVQDVRQAAAVAARVIVRIANADAWPLQHRTQDAIRALLEKEGLLDILDAEGRPFGTPFRPHPTVRYRWNMLRDA